MSLVTPDGIPDLLNAWAPVARFVRVYLDGVEQFKCTAADRSEGWVEQDDARGKGARRYGVVTYRYCEDEKRS